MAGFTVESEDEDYKVEVIVHYDDDLDPQVPWNAVAHCCGEAAEELNNRIMKYLDTVAVAEAKAIIATTPTVRAWQTPPRPGPGRPPRDNAWFGFLTPSQVAVIRRKVKEKGEKEIPALAEFYDVQEMYVERAMNGSKKK